MEKDQCTSTNLVDAPKTKSSKTEKADKDEKMDIE